MINVSNEFKNLMNERTDFMEKAEVTLSDGTVLNFDENDFTLSNNYYAEGAEANSIPLGVAICRTIQIELMNDDDHLKSYDFFGAKIRLYLTFELSSTTEMVEIGKFTVITPETYGETVILTASDDMYRADKAYSTKLTFPQSAGAVLRDICSTCDISLRSSDFLNNDFVIQSQPSPQLTYRQVIGYIAMIAVGNARIDRQGYLNILTYSFDYTEYHDLTEWNTLKISTSDISVTGVQTTRTVTAQDDEGTETQTEETILVGEEGYVLAVENPLITGIEEDVINAIWNVFNGQNFRSFEGDYIGYPIAEFMDVCKVSDHKGNTYNSFITDITYTFCSFTTLKNSAESSLINNITYSSESTKAIIKAEELVEKEKTDRELMQEKLNELLKNSSGMFSTEVEQEDGSTIYYLHDKPTIEESKNVMKLTAEAIGFSTDGGKTYPFGFTLSGEMVMEIIAAEGINADWIRTGSLEVRDDNGNVLFSVDLDTKNVIISGDAVVIRGSSGDSTASEEIKNANGTADKALEEAQKSNSLVVTLSNEYQGIQTDYLGNYTTFPNCQTTVDCYYGSENVNDIVDIEVSEYRLSGEWNAATRTYTVTDLAADDGSVTFNVTYTNLKTTITVSKVFNISKIKGGQNGLDGLQGKDGSDGVSIYDMFVYWTLSDSSTDLPTIVNWSTTKPDRPVGKYLWRYDEYHFSNGDVYTSDPYVTTGDEGESGSTSYFHIKYSSVENPTSSSQMTETPAEYIGTYVDYVEEDSTDPSKYTWSRFQGLQGEKGDQGIPGTNGADGQTSYLHIKYSNDGGKTFTANNGETTGDYIGQYVDFTIDDSTDPSKYNWSLTKGEDARTYILESSDTVIKLGADNAMTPSSVTFKAYYRDGSSASRTAYSGRFKIEETTNGSTWTTKYTSSSNESSKTYTPSSVNVTNVRCTLYASGGTSTQLDIQTVAILVDVSNIDVIEEINMSNDTITITGNRIYIKSDYFELSKDGSINMSGGTIKGSGGEFTKSFAVKVPFGVGLLDTTFSVDDSGINVGLYLNENTTDPQASNYENYINFGAQGGMKLYAGSMNAYVRNLFSIYSQSGDEIASFSKQSEEINLNLPVKTAKSIAPTTSGNYACGLSDARWSTVYTTALNASGVSHLDGQVWFNGVADENFQTVQTYAANMYIGSSGRVWKRSASSSRLIKHDIKELGCAKEIAAERLLDVKIVQFKYNDGVISDSDQRYGMDLPGFIIEDLDEKYPICIDKLGENKKEWSWNSQFLIPGMLKLIQDLFKRVDEIERDQNEYQSN